MLRQWNLWLKLWSSRRQAHLSSATGSWPWARRLIYRSGHCHGRGLSTCVPCRIHVTRSAFLLSNSNHDAAIVMSTNEVAVGAGRRRPAFSFSKGPVLRRPSLGSEQAAHHTCMYTAQAWQCCGKIALLCIPANPGSAGCTALQPGGFQGARRSLKESGRSFDLNIVRDNRNVCSITERASLRSAQQNFRIFRTFGGKCLNSVIPYAINFRTANSRKMKMKQKYIRTRVCNTTHY